MVQASGYGGFVTWFFCTVALALVTSLLADRWHYLVSALATFVVLVSVTAASLNSYSRYGGDASAYFRQNLDIIGIMLVIALFTAFVATLFVIKWRRR